MKKIFVVIILLALCASLFGSVPMSKQNISINAGGPLSIGHFEYQYSVFQTPKSSLSLSAGMGFNGSDIPLPLGLVYCYGNKNQVLLGLHYVPNLDFNRYGSDMDEPLFEDSDLENYAFRLGYRRLFIGKEDTYFIQAYFTPVIMFRETRTDIRSTVCLGFGVYI